MVFLTLTNMFGIGAISEVLFAVVTLLIAFFAIKIYKLTRVDSYKLFGLGFIFIACAYLFKSLVNLFLFLEYVRPGAIASKLTDISTLFGYSIIVHIILMVLALLLLFNLVLKIKNRTVFLVLMILTFFPLVLTSMHYSIFYALASLFLVVLFAYYFRNYLKVRKKSALMVALGFGFIFLAHFLYIFIEYRNLYFVLGHISEFIGYLVLLIGFIKVLRK